MTLEEAEVKVHYDLNTYDLNNIGHNQLYFYRGIVDNFSQLAEIRKKEDTGEPTPKASRVKKEKADDENKNVDFDKFHAFGEYVTRAHPDSTSNNYLNFLFVALLRMKIMTESQNVMRKRKEKNLISTIDSMTIKKKTQWRLRKKKENKINSN